MFALFLIALLALAACVAIGALADSGLRWWSAFGDLRREMRRTAVIADLPQLRPMLSTIPQASVARTPRRSSITRSAPRAA